MERFSNPFQILWHHLHTLGREQRQSSGSSLSPQKKKNPGFTDLLFPLLEYLSWSKQEKINLKLNILWKRIKDWNGERLFFLPSPIYPNRSMHFTIMSYFFKKRFPHKVCCFYLRKKKYFDKNVLLESTNGYNYPIKLIKICDQYDISDTLINFFISMQYWCCQ